MKTLKEIALGTLIAMALLCLFMAPAFATGSHSPPTTTPYPTVPSSSVSQVSQMTNSANSLSKSQAKSSADARSSSISGSSSKASGGKAQQSLSNQNSATGGTSTSTAVAAPVVTNSAGNGDQETIIHGDTYEAAKVPVNTAIAGGTNTTAECRYSVGAGGQASVLGLSFGLGRKDRDCERVILANAMYDRGNLDAGDVLMCRIRELREAFGADCLAMLQRSRVAVPGGPTAHQLEQRAAFERGDHLK